jgi:hypothetical protein
MSIRRIVAVAAAGVLCVSSLTAQGALSTQGFGYPFGELSTRALSLGGAVGEFDLQSPINPAALGIGTRSGAWVQYSPEFRSLNAGNGTFTNTTARFPLFGVTAKYEDFTVGMSFTSYLDRTWTNSYDDTLMLGGVRTPSHATAQSTGGINDARLALAWAINPKLSIGLGLHVLPGQNKVLLARDFVDTLKIGSYTNASTITYIGQALSLGITGTPVEHLNVAGSIRLGGPMQVRAGDSTLVGEGRVPMRLGVSAAYEGFAGSAIVVRYDTERWSSLKGLGSAAVNLHDATTLSAGVEFAGPKLGGLPIALRVGALSRTLPFSSTADAVKESGLSSGVGLAFAQGRFALDIGALFATRTASGLTEKATTLSVGLAIRP